MVLSATKERGQIGNGEYMVKRIGAEIAEASRVATGTKTAMVASKHTDFLVQVARQLERLQTKRRRLRRDLKLLDEEIRLRKRELKAAAQAIGRGKDEEL